MVSRSRIPGDVNRADSCRRYLVFQSCICVEDSDDSSDDRPSVRMSDEDDFLPRPGDICNELRRSEDELCRVYVPTQQTGSYILCHVFRARIAQHIDAGDGCVCFHHECRGSLSKMVSTKITSESSNNNHGCRLVVCLLNYFESGSVIHFRDSDPPRWQSHCTIMNHALRRRHIRCR